VGVPVKTLALKRAQTVPAEEQLGRFKAFVSVLGSVSVSVSGSVSVRVCLCVCVCVSVCV
jgi:hypothetical protein